MKKNKNMKKISLIVCIIVVSLVSMGILWKNLYYDKNKKNLNDENKLVVDKQHAEEDNRDKEDKKNQQLGDKDTIYKERQAGGIEFNKEKEKELLKKYNQLIKENKSEDELAKFTSDNIKDISKQKASEIVLAIEEKQKQNLQSRLSYFFTGDVQVKIKREFPKEINMEKLDNIKDEELKSYLKDLKNSGYKLINDGESYYPIIDYKFFRKYENKVTSDVKEYINIMATCSEKPSFLNEKLNVDFHVLSNRIIKEKNFLDKYPKSKRYKEIKEIYTNDVKFAQNNIDK